MTVYPAPKPEPRDKEPFDATEWQRRGVESYAAKRESEQRERKKADRNYRPLRENVERRRRLEAEQFGPYAAWIRKKACIIGGRCWTVVQAAHFHGRGAGGKSESLFPCCAEHHSEQHTIGIATWQRKYGIDLEAVTAHLRREYEESF